MKITDFYTKNKNEFRNEISLYVCGPTVYDQPHIGNMRPIITFDIFNRVASLESKVNFLHNITDVDDKIINKAMDLNTDEKSISMKYEKEYLDLLNDLNIKVPNKMPKVTENINGMIDFIKRIIKKGYGYESGGNVFFNTKKFTNYSKLDNSNLEGLIINGDDDKNIDSLKINSSDFALWKKTNVGKQWTSPWGEGRPGWHTECAFFIDNEFGSKGVDVHGGGIDLKFPHHINEMAQFESLNETDMSKSWMYVGHVNIQKTKMSKSLGNTITAKDFIEKHSPKILRMMFITNSASKPINISDNLIYNTEKTLSKIENSIVKTIIELSKKNKLHFNFKYEPTNDFVNILKDNLNTSKAITKILEDIKILNSEKELDMKGIMLKDILSNLNLLGFDYKINNQNLTLLNEAIKEQNYVEIDNIKKELLK